MRLLNRVLRGFSALVRRRRTDQELDEELHAYFQAAVERHVQAGMSRKDALRAARVEMGSVQAIKDHTRDAGWESTLESVWQDARYALRMLRRSPGFASVAILTLALGIGANSAMFGLTNALLVRPLYDRPNEVVGVYDRNMTPPGGYRAFSYPNYRDLREQSSIFANLSAFGVALVGVTEGEITRRTMAYAVSANYFDTLGRPPALGRAFSLEEERPGANIRVAIASHDYWDRKGRNPDVIGQTIRINGDQFTVVGVAREGFTGTGVVGAELWVPLGVYDTIAGDLISRRDERLSARTAHDLLVVGRLRPGMSADAAAPELTAVARQLAQAFPSDNANHTFEISRPSRLDISDNPGNDTQVAGLAALLMGMAVVALLVACLNLANLLLARGRVRRQEIAVRLSLGGGRRRLFRQLLTEGLMLGLAGGAVGLVVSAWANDALLSSLDAVIPASVGLPDPGTDWRVIAATVGFSVLATMFFGAWPAWTMTRSDVLGGLKQQAGEAPRSGGRLRVGHGLVIGQVALALALLTAGGLFFMSSRSASSATPGFSLERGLLVDLDAGLAGYDEARGRQTYRAMVDRLRAVPGVEAVSLASLVPLGAFSRSRGVVPAGSAGQSSPTTARFAIVGRDYFQALGLPVLRGRDFLDAELDPGGWARVAIIDDALARSLWPGEDALGRQIQFVNGQAQDAEPVMEIVGIVPAVKHQLADAQPVPHVYVPLGHEYQNAMTLHVRIAGAGDEVERAMLGTLARLVHSVDERVPILALKTWRDHRDASIEVWMFQAGAKVFTAFAGLALLLTVIGVYGVKAYVVSGRTREFGVRMAIGARPRDVLWLVLREGSRVTAIGIGIGLLLAVGTGRLLQSLLYGVRAIEPLVLLSAPLVLIVASLLASYFPARRATQVDPMVALRYE